jgi:RNA polymerase sigma-70 factor (ECF subfamily)
MEKPTQKINPDVPSEAPTAMIETPAKEEEILSLIRQPGGMDKGFRLLMSTYQERLYFQVRRMVTEHEDANDVLQNCLVKVYRNIDRFEGKSSLYTWLYRIATNEALTFLKQKKKRNSLPLEQEEGPDLGERLKADPWFDGDEAQIRLQEAIDQLPEKQQIVFRLRYFEEMSYKEMAQVLDTSEGALKASFHHATKKIEKRIIES